VYILPKRRYFLGKEKFGHTYQKQKAPGISSKRIPFTCMNMERSKTRNNKHAQPRKTKINSSKKKRPISPW